MKYEKKTPGSSDYLDEVWDLKEEIRRNEGFLQQAWSFFSRAYKRNVCHLFLDDGRLAGFATVRRDGYILFLGVDPEYRGEGLGKELVRKCEEDHNKVSCHARVSNQNALEFYQHLGFEVEEEINSYYENGDAAYYLTKNIRESSIKNKISEILMRSSSED